MSSSVAGFLRCPAIRPIIKPRHFSSLAFSLADPRVLAPKILTQSRILSLTSVRFASSKIVTSEDKIKSTNKKVTRFLEDEIESVQEAVEKRPQEAQLPKDSPFEIIDSPGHLSIILKQEFQGEKIQVAVSTYDEDDEDTDEEEAAQDTDEEEAEQDAAEGQNTDDDLEPISLVVTIDKGAGLTLEFCCDLDAEDLTIESIAMKRLRDSEAEAEVIKGPDFSDLEEGFQRALYRYLGTRGIKVSLYEFLQEYMKTKDKKEYILWLKNLKEFVEK